MTALFSKILIANRGEIAVRILKTCRRLGIKTVVVYSEADAGSLAVEMADEAVLIGAAPAAQSYLLADKIIAAAKQTGAEAVHPGFGFLSEKAEFARQLKAAGLVFIGPNPEAIDAMGDKIESKKFAAAAKVSTVPGYLGVIDGVPHAIEIAEQIGYPVMMKASAGGGGKGMRIAFNRQDVEEGFPAAKAEAIASFGDDRVFIEKFVTQPRHIEIQVLGDKHGQVIHLHERECSIQRRNQKVIEEAPSPFLDEATRAAMGAQAVALAKAVNYDSAGTVEFIVDGARNFYFLEMNTRLQVEHPVTELITGVDLVEQMIRVAAGEKLTLTQETLPLRGWAIESRIYAEDPYRGFLPSIGRLVRYLPPEEGVFEAEAGAVTVRNDAGVVEGDEISMFYDPMIAKLCTHGPDRLSAIEAMADALETFYIEGVGHNIPFLSAVMEQQRFRSGALTTGYIAEEFQGGFVGAIADQDQLDMMVAAAAWRHALAETRAIGGLETNRLSVRITPDVGQAHRVEVVLSEGEDGAGICVSYLDPDGEIEREILLSDVDWRPGEPQFFAHLDDMAFALEIKVQGDGVRLRHRAARAHVQILRPQLADFYERLPVRAAADTSGTILSPMPGLVVSIDVNEGQEVKSGQVVAIVEAMKMQNLIRAERDGKVKKIGAKAGDAVAADDVLVELA